MIIRNSSPECVFLLISEDGLGERVWKRKKDRNSVDIIDGEPMVDKRGGYKHCWQSKGRFSARSHARCT